MKNVYVYRHRRLDKNEIFYVGIGINNRGYVKSNRSIYWKSITNKTDYSIEIIQENLSWEEACELEIFLISLYGRKDLGLGNLVNMTDGGDGGLGWVPSEETKNKIKNSQIGELGYWFGKERSQSVKDKMSLVRTVNPPFKNRKHSEETLLIMRESKKSRDLISTISHTKETRDKMSMNNNMSKIVLDTQQGIFFNSVEEASKCFNIKPKTLSPMLRGDRKNKTSLIYC